MIDLHSHIFQFDDGAQIMEDSVKVAKQEVHEGIHTIAANPHHQNRKYINEKNEILHRVSVLNNYLIQENIPLIILPGQESPIYEGIIRDYRNGKMLTLNQLNKYIFIVLPSSQMPQFIARLIYDIQAEAGRRIPSIFVPPERSRRAFYIILSTKVR